MAYDEGLAERLRDALRDTPDVQEKRMFGGLCFMIRGHMAVGIVKEELMLRVGADGYADALAQPHAREMDFTGRALKGMVYVGVPGLRTEASLGGWVERALAFNRTLEAKAAGTKTRSRRTR